jgi:ABC-type multidrug transport system fused ATPase/permease subunit
VVQNYLSYPRRTFETIQKTSSNDDLLYYLFLYLGVTAVMSFEGTLRYYVVFQGGINAGRIMFRRLTYAVLRAPLRWLDTVPVGRILNRFTTDFNAFDISLAYGLTFMFWNFLAVIGVAIAG